MGAGVEPTTFSIRAILFTNSTIASSIAISKYLGTFNVTYYRKLLMSWVEIGLA